MSFDRKDGWRLMPRILALALAVAPHARAEDPQQALPAAPAAVAPPLPASAFQAAKVLLGKLEGLNPRGERWALASFEATRVAPREERGEYVKIEVELTLTTPDAAATVAAWIKDLKLEKAVVDARIGEGTATSADAATASVSACRVRVEVDWDPTKAPPRDPKDRGATSATDSTSYIWIAAARDKVEVGAVHTVSAMRRIPGTDWVEERWTIRSRDPARTLPRLPIHNFATVLEWDHPYTSVTRYCLLSAPGPGVEKRMELELTLLRRGRADELGATPGKR